MKNQTYSKDLTSAFCVLAKPIFVAIAWCAMAGSLWGAPFAQWIATKSPQGIPIRIWGQGDEYSARFEAEDGHAVVYDPQIKAYAYARKDATTGALVTTGIAVGDETPGDQVLITGISPHERDTSDAFYAQRKERIDADESNAETLKRWRNQKATHRQRRRYKRAIDNGEEMPLMAPPSSHTVGQIVGVTLLIDFPTSSDGSGSLAQEVHPNVTKTDLEQLVNGENFSKWGNASSVRKYYEDVSGGNLVYTNIVLGWFKAAHVRSYYDNPDEDNGPSARMLIGEILEQIANSPNYETTYLPLLQQVSYSGSYFKALNVFFAGQSAEVWGKGLWAHKSSLSSTYTKLPVKIGAATKYFYNYQITPVTDEPTIGTFCHENGHMICGFPDLYSYKDGGGNGIGAFCLMCSHGSNNPQYFCAYLRAAAGWVTPREMPTGVNVLSVSNRLDDVWSYTNPSDDCQYFLIENRKREGRDSYLPGGGILIWRCDENGDSEYSDSLPGFGGMAKHRRSYEVSLEQADGLYELEREVNNGQVTDCWYRGNPSSESGLVFSDATEPCAKWKDGSSSGLVMSGFSQNDYVMTFHVGEVVESSYTIDYSLGGGTFGSSHPSGAKQDEVFYVSAPTRGNDTFVGWSVSGLDNPAAKWGTTSNPDTAIANAATRCSNGTSGKVYFKDLALKDGDRVTLIANWRPASPPEESGDWYVSSVWGDDANAGTSWAAPFATLQKAVDSARSAAPTIIVYDGQYEPFEVENFVNLHVRSVNGAERTIIDGSLQWSKGVTNRCATFYMNSQTLTGFTLMNGRQPNGNGGGSYSGIISNCIYRCNSANQGGGAYNGSQYGCRFLDNTATYGGGACFGNRYGCIFNGNHADTGGGSYGGMLRGCLLYGNSAKWGGGIYDGTLTNCTLSKNSADNYGGGTYGGTLCNCIVWDNVSRIGLNVYSSDCSWTCTTPMESGEGNRCDNPKFVDGRNCDFHLSEDSPCINAGANQYVDQERDLDGSPRIVAETVDMGAYERQEWTPIENHSVTFDLGEHGTRVGGGALVQSVAHGNAAVAPIITPETGYTFSGWDRVFTNVTCDLTVKAKYSAVSYRIDYFNTRGSANANPNTYTVEDEVTFAALADLPAWRFAGWEPARIVRGTTGDFVVTARWERVQATVDDGSGKTWYVGDTYERTIESPVVNGGTQLVLSAWSVWNGTVTNLIASGTNATIRFEIRNAEPYGVETEWMTNYWLEVVAPTNGTILGAESGWQLAGAEPYLTAIPAEGFSFVGWFGDTDGCSVTNGGATLAVPMDRARKIGADFARNVYTVTFDLGEHGTRVGGGELTQAVAHGEAAVAPTVKADAGWDFAGWSNPFDCVVSNLTVTAIYDHVQPTDIPEFFDVRDYVAAENADAYMDGDDLVLVYTDTDEMGIVNFDGSGECRLLVVAGGGAGGGFAGGGGGGGGVIETNFCFSPGGYMIKVGKGGLCGSGWSARDRDYGAGNGYDSYVADMNREVVYRAVGGGGGAGWSTYLINEATPAFVGGSSGGGVGQYRDNWLSIATSYISPEPLWSGSQGHRGGDACPNWYSGGGGGAGGEGTDGSYAEAGNGGPGYACDITGEIEYYAAGGGASRCGGGGEGSRNGVPYGTNGLCFATLGGEGGLGGGGNGARGISEYGQAATGWGGGGGGGGVYTDYNNQNGHGGSGFQGIVILRIRNFTPARTAKPSWMQKIRTEGAIIRHEDDGSVLLCYPGSSAAGVLRLEGKATISEALFVGGGGGGGRGAGDGGNGGGFVYTNGLELSSGQYCVKAGLGGLGGYGLWYNGLSATANDGGDSYLALNQDTLICAEGGTAGVSTNSTRDVVGNGGDGAGTLGEIGRLSGIYGYGGNGGEGLSCAITGEEIWYAGGGGGGGFNTTGPITNGGFGGGGNAGWVMGSLPGSGGDGVDGLGGGGGAGASGSSGRIVSGGRGGDGVVILRITEVGESDISMPDWAGCVDVTGTSDYWFDTNGEMVVRFVNPERAGRLVVRGAVDYEALLVGGGGGGGVAPMGSMGGGGGGGGFLPLVNRFEPLKDPYAPTVFDIAVGAGGAPGWANGGAYANRHGGASGEDSVLGINGEERFRAWGGGGGGTGTGGSFVPTLDADPNYNHGKAGGSGGGSTGASSWTSSIAGGAANGGAAQGCRGGDAIWLENISFAGGGGGAGEDGGIGAITNGVRVAGKGGDGLASCITGSEVWYGGGGGAGMNSWSYSYSTNKVWVRKFPVSGGEGGKGGGGAGNVSPMSDGDAPDETRRGESGLPNTGGGGGGACDESSVNQWSYAGAGGSGVVIVRIHEVRPAPLPIPEATSNLTYTGHTQEGIPYRSDYYSVIGGLAVTAGVYRAQVTLKNANDRWQGLDPSVRTVEVSWRILLAEFEMAAPSPMAWCEGIEPTAPEVAAPFGIVRYEWSRDAGATWQRWENGRPQTAGDYLLRAVVDATDNWHGAVSSVVQIRVMTAEEAAVTAWNDRILLMNDRPAGEDGLPVIGEHYGNIAEGAAARWLHEPSGAFEFDLSIRSLNVLPGTAHQYVDERDEILWNLVEVRFGNNYPDWDYAPDEERKFWEFPQRNFLPWNPAESDVLGEAPVGSRCSMVGQAILRNVADAAIETGVLTSGVGTVVFDAVNALTRSAATEDAALAVEVQAEEGVWHPVSVTPIRVQGDMMTVASPVEEVVLAEETGGSISNFYRLVATVNCGDPARIRIRRTRFAAGGDADEASPILIDNLVVSLPEEGASRYAGILGLQNVREARVDAAVEQIDAFVFTGHRALEDVWFQSDCPAFGDDPFALTPMTLTVHCPAEAAGWDAVVLGRTVEPWSKSLVTFDLGEFGERIGGGALNQRVPMFGAAEAPVVVGLNHRVFLGWDRDFTSVQADITVRALYSSGARHTVRFDVGEGAARWLGGGALVQEVYDHQSAELPSLQLRDGFALVRWEGDPTTITEPVTLTAIYRRVNDGSIVSEIIDGREWCGRVQANCVVVTGVSPSAGCVVVPERICSLPVTVIGDGAFTGVRDMEELVIASTVTNLEVKTGYSLVKDCQSLRRLDFGESVFNPGIRVDQLIVNCPVLEEIAFASDYASYMQYPYSWEMAVRYLFSTSRSQMLTRMYFRGNAPSGYLSNCPTNLSWFVTRGTTGWGEDENGVLPSKWPKEVPSDSSAVQVNLRYWDDAYPVRFDLGGCGQRVGGGALEQAVVRSSAAELPEVEGTFGWKFLRWDADVSNVTGPMTVHAVYTDESEHEVVFDAGEHGQLEVAGKVTADCRASVTDRGAVVPPLVVAESGWQFVGWDRDLNDVTSDCKVHAVYAPLAAGETIRESVEGYEWVATVDGEYATIVSVWPKEGDVVMPENMGGKRVMTFLQNVFAQTGFTSVTIANSVTGMPRGAFDRMQKLESLVIGDGVETVYQLGSCYSQSVWSNLVVGSHVRYIEASSSYDVWTMGCLKKVVFRGAEPRFFPYYSLSKPSSFVTLTESKLSSDLRFYATYGTAGWIDPATGELPPLWNSRPIEWLDESYPVRFDLGEGGVRVGGGELEQMVVRGHAAIAPEVAGLDGMTFLRWDGELDHILGETVFRAVYSSGEAHTVTFDLGEHGRWVGGGALEQTVLDAEAPILPEVEAETGWRFVGWEGANPESVVADCRFVASYAVIDGPLTVRERLGGVELVVGITSNAATIIDVALLNSTDVEIPAYIMGKPVTSIGNAFVGSWATSIVIPDTVVGQVVSSAPTYQTDQVFNILSNCPNLTNLVIGSGVTSVGFTVPYTSSCLWPKLSRLVIGAGVKNISCSSSSSSIFPNLVELYFAGDCPNGFSAGSYAARYLVTQGNSNLVVYVTRNTTGWTDAANELPAQFSGRELRWWDDSVTVMFDLGENGTRVGGGETIQQVVRGCAAEMPDVRGVDGWVFRRWNCAFDRVLSNTTVRAVYSNGRRHLVTFDLGEHGSRVGGGLTEQLVYEGDTVTTPVVEANSGWLFVGWSETFGGIDCDCTAVARYLPITDTVDISETIDGWTWTGVLSNKDCVTVTNCTAKGGNVKVPSYLLGKRVVALDQMTFADASWRWLQYALEIPDTFEGRFNWYNGNLLYFTSLTVGNSVTNVSLLAYGSSSRFDLVLGTNVHVVSSSYGSPARFYFNGDAVVGAMPINSNQVIFVTHGTEGWTDENGVLPDRWPDENGARIRWWEAYHHVTFDIGAWGERVGGGLLEQRVMHGYAAELPEIEWREGRVFGGWEGETDSILKDVVLRPRFLNGQKFTVTFDLGEHGTRVGGGELTQTIVCGEAAVAPEVEPEFGWRFLGWSESFSSITGTTQVAAQWEHRQATVEDGGSATNAWFVGETYEREFGTVCPADGVRYDCIGWSVRHGLDDEIVAAGTNGTARFDIVDEGPYAVDVSWRTNYWLEISAATNGIVRGATNGWYEAGTVLELVAIPDVNFSAVTWHGDLEGCETAAYGNRLTVPMTCPRWIGVGFDSVAKSDYGPFGHGDELRNPDMVPPAIMLDTPVSVYGERVPAGCCIGVYRKDTGDLCGLGKVYDDSSSVHMLNVFVPSGVGVTFKVARWSLDVDPYRVIDADRCCDLIVPEAGGTIRDARITVGAVSEQKVSLVGAKWHAVSFFVRPEDNSPAAVFGAVSGAVERVSRNDLSWMPGFGSGSLTEIAIGNAYWVRTLESNVTWTVSGATAPETEIALSVGWNHIGYAPETAGKVSEVLATALAAGLIADVVHGVESYSGGLTGMSPGQCYWVYAPAPATIRYDRVSASKTPPRLLKAAVGTANSYGPFGTGEDVEQGPGLPPFVIHSIVSVYGRKIAKGDCVAAYRSTESGTRKLCGLGRVKDEVGNLTVVGYAPTGSEITFKVWTAAGGEAGTTYETDKNCAMTVTSGMAPVTGKELTVAAPRSVVVGTEEQDVAQKALSEIVREATAAGKTVVVTGDVSEDLKLNPGARIEVQDGRVRGDIKVVVAGEKGVSYDITDYVKIIASETEMMTVIEPALDAEKVPEPEIGGVDEVGQSLVVETADSGLVVGVSVGEAVPGLFYSLESCDDLSFGTPEIDDCGQATGEGRLKLESKPSKSRKRFFRVSAHATPPQLP